MGIRMILLLDAVPHTAYKLQVVATALLYTRSDYYSCSTSTLLCSAAEPAGGGYGMTQRAHAMNIAHHAIARRAGTILLSDSSSR